MKDQYGKFHLLPKYIDKFSLSERKEPDELDNLKLTTLEELAHYVRTVPFIPPAQCIRGKFIKIFKFLVFLSKKFNFK